MEYSFLSMQILITLPILLLNTNLHNEFKFFSQFYKFIIWNISANVINVK